MHSKSADQPSTSLCVITQAQEKYSIKHDLRLACMLTINAISAFPFRSWNMQSQGETPWCSTVLNLLSCCKRPQFTDGETVGRLVAREAAKYLQPSKLEVTRLRSYPGTQVLIGGSSTCASTEARLIQHDEARGVLKFLSVIRWVMRCVRHDPESNSSGNSLGSFVQDIQYTFRHRPISAEQRLLDHLVMVDVNGLRISN
ncbi:hypothetical protein EV421DRAFT_1736375 [Armillaria borealis]|uniref:Uncharacterized protein n=1 Tax=Armillaria borealis TaxID=47425 RepID=A0AA39JG29_9AGAR|nr:hypothetical protein EV421DRAFT_1736375 [Armillaria borealis]